VAGARSSPAAIVAGQPATSTRPRPALQDTPIASAPVPALNQHSMRLMVRRPGSSSGSRLACVHLIAAAVDYGPYINYNNKIMSPSRMYERAAPLGQIKYNSEFKYN
jgi:hypothetical protein